MRSLRAVVAIGCACWLAACGSAEPVSGDISKVVDVKSSFGPEFKVTDIKKTGIDPKLLGEKQLPEGLTFEPAQCSKTVVDQQLPSGLQGNMAAVQAEGNGNRFIVMALETSEPLPFSVPQHECQQVGYQKGNFRGVNEVVDAPHIDGVKTSAVRIVLQVVSGETTRSGELYKYTANFGDFRVVVTANALVEADKETAKVDTARASELLTAAVAAVRS